MHVNWGKLEGTVLVTSLQALTVVLYIRCIHCRMMSCNAMHCTVLWILLFMAGMV